MVGIACLFCKNNELSANYKEKSGKPLVVIQLILLHTFHLPCPNYKRNGLYKDITGAQAHGLRSTLLEMMYMIIDGHDETGLGSKHIEFCIYSFDKHEDEVSRHMMATQRVVATLKRKAAFLHLILDDLTEIEVDIGLHAEA